MVNPTIQVDFWRKKDTVLSAFGDPILGPYGEHQNNLKKKPVKGLYDRDT